MDLGNESSHLSGDDPNNIKHEFKSPITTVRLCAQLVRRLDPKFEEALSIEFQNERETIAGLLDESADKLLELTNSINN